MRRNLAPLLTVALALALALALPLALTLALVRTRTHVRAGVSPTGARDRRAPQQCLHATRLSARRGQPGARLAAHLGRMETAVGETGQDGSNKLPQSSLLSLTLRLVSESRRSYSIREKGRHPIWVAKHIGGKLFFFFIF